MSTSRRRLLRTGAVILALATVGLGIHLLVRALVALHT